MYYIPPLFTATAECRLIRNDLMGNEWRQNTQESRSLTRTTSSPENPGRLPQTCVSLLPGFSGSGKPGFQPPKFSRLLRALGVINFRINFIRPALSVSKRNFLY